MATDDWILGGTGNWTNAGNWDSGVPTSSDDVNIVNSIQIGVVKATSGGTVVINTLKIGFDDRLTVDGGLFEATNGTPEGIFGDILVENAGFKVDSGTINNSGLIELVPTTSAATNLVITDTVELNGAGSIVFSGNGNNAITGGSAAGKLINADNNISGNGTIYEIFFTNDGTIETGAQTFDIWGSAFLGNFDNEGSVYADNGGTLLFGVPTGSTASTIINNGTIGLRSTGTATHLQIAGNVTIQGSGQVLFEGSTPSADTIGSNGQSATLNLDGGTLSGAGNLGDAHLTLNIEAGSTVEATGRYLPMNTGANAIVNAGIITANDGSQLGIESAIQNAGLVVAPDVDGSIDFDAQNNFNGPTGAILALGGNIDFFGTTTNEGVIEVANNGEIGVHADILGSNSGQIEIGSGGLLDLTDGNISQGVEFIGGGATLELDNDAGQIGTDISGLTAGDSIDLTFLSFATGDHAVWTQSSGDEGMITIETVNNSPLAPLVVEGTWNSQDFTVTADGGGGTLVALQGAASYVEHAGNNDEWVMNDGQWAGSAGPGSHPSGYNVAGIGDWTGSGTDGILWFDPTTGGTDEWQLSNAQWAASVDLGTHPGNYQISGVGDFNGDGTSDVLWTSTSGGAVQTDIWELGSDGKWANSVSPGTHPAGYTVAGIGDWTGNGTDGILWYNPSTGATDEWQLANGHWAASVDLGSHPGNYQISGIGDFNGDGTDDVLWTGVNGNGTVSTDIWELGANGQWINSVSPGTHPAGYQVAGVGDLAGTGTSDILWYNSSTGDTDEWLINNGQWAGSVDLGIHPGTAQIAGVGDFTGSGTKDILWHSAS